MADNATKIIATTVLFVSAFAILGTGYFGSIFAVTYSGLNLTEIVNQSASGSYISPTGNLQLQPMPVCNFNNNLLFAIVDGVGCVASMVGWFAQFLGIQTNIWWLAPFFGAIAAVTLYILARLGRGGG